MKTKRLFLITCLILFGVITEGNAQQWNLTGNAGTNAATNFIGTTDNNDVVFKRYNLNSGLISTYNTSFGVNALSVNTPFHNTAFGAGALNSITVSSPGGYNVAFGSQALNKLTSGAGGNTAIGTSALSLMTTGDSNVALGYLAMRNATGGQNNIGVGREAMYKIDSGSNNVAIGQASMSSAVSGTSNIALGAAALSAHANPVGNVVIGSSAYATSTGDNNIGLGGSSGKDNLNGSYNIALGINASAGNNIAQTSGNSNILLGNGTRTMGLTHNTLNIGDVLYGTNIYNKNSNNGNQYARGRIGIGVITPNNTLEIQSETSGTSGLRFTNLLNTNTSITNTTSKVLSVNATGDVILVNDKQGTGGETTNALISSVNTMTSTVNGIVATAPIVNSVLNAIVGNQLTTTVNGVASSPIVLPSLTEVDGSTTNELSNLSLTGNVLTLTNPLTPGNSITLPIYSDIDGQTLTLTGNDLSISNGNTITLPSLTEVDGSVTNELQTLSIAGNQLTISNGNTVALPSTVADGSETIIQAGANVTVTGSGTTGSPYVINSTATGGGGSDINIYKDNGTITPANGVRTVTMNNNNLVFDTTGSTTNGRIYIGSSPGFPTTTGDYRLNVEGGILTEKVKVALRSTANWADYVFANNYKLMPLSEVETFVKTNKHLPGISSAEDLVNEGLDLGEMQAKQMGKIEELTLYVIEQNKTIEKQSKEIEELKALVNVLVNKNK